MTGLLVEYFNSGDIKEACLSASELKPRFKKIRHEDGDESTKLGLHFLIFQGLTLAIERKDKERALLPKLFVDMYQQKILARDHFKQGYAQVLEFAEDSIIDNPKFVEHIATIMGKLVASGVMDLNYLSGKQTEPLTPENRAKFAAGVLKTVKAEAGDKLPSLYKDSGLKLSSVLTPESSVEAFLKEQDLGVLVGVAS